MGRRILYFALLAGLAAVPGPASAQIQSTYDYLLLPHAPQSDSARTYSYDANGNLVRSTIRSTGASKVLEYTPSNMIFKAGGSEYRYDTSGNRIAKIQRDANGNITKIERYFGAIETDGTTRTRYYFFGSRRVAKKTSSGALSFYHSDHLNSTSVVTDASGNLQSRMEFYEFGAVKSQEGTDSPKYAYTGQEWDKETNLYNYNARMYDSAIGKFASADTIIPDITNPQSLNRYAYVRNNPLGRIDPTGHADGEPRSNMASYFSALKDENRRSWQQARNHEGEFKNVSTVVSFPGHYLVHGGLSILEGFAGALDHAANAYPDFKEGNRETTTLAMMDLTLMGPGRGSVVVSGKSQLFEASATAPSRILGAREAALLRETGSVAPRVPLGSTIEEIAAQIDNHVYENARGKRTPFYSFALPDGFHAESLFTANAIQDTGEAYRFIARPGLEGFAVEPRRAGMRHYDRISGTRHESTGIAREFLVPGYNAEAGILERFVPGSGRSWSEQWETGHWETVTIEGR